MALYFLVVDFDGGYCLHVTDHHVSENELQELVGSSGRLAQCFRFPVRESDGASVAAIEHMLDEYPSLKTELLGLMAEVLAVGTRLPPATTTEGDIFKESYLQILLLDDENTKN